MISIIVPCYNHFELTQRFILSLPDNTLYESEIILIDDCSSDATQYLNKFEMGIDKIIRHPTNMGFPKSVNDGIDAAEGKYIAIFNNDVVVKEIWDEPLVDALNRYPELGMVMGKCYNSKEDSLKHIDTREIKVWNRGLPFFMLKSVQKEIGKWDERFYPSWYDDIDMEIRLVQHGYKFGVAEDSYCIHYGSQTLIGPIPQWGDFKRLSAERFMEKWGLKDASSFIDFPALLKTGKIRATSPEEYHKEEYYLR
jgi:GT2 family glycosyltransferase